MKKHSSVFLFLLFFTPAVFAQVNENRIREAVFIAAQEFKLSSEDLHGYIISDNYTQKNGHSHVYLTQTANGFEIFNAQLQLHFSEDGKLAFSNSRFIPEKNSKTNTTSPNISVETAFQQAIELLGISNERITIRKENTDNKNKFLLYNEDFLSRHVRATLGYELANETLILAYKLIIEPKNSSDMFNVRIDAQTGKIIAINNRTLYCAESHVHNLISCTHSDAAPTTTLKLNAAATYNAYPLGVESPIHGNRQLISGAESSTASPFGWHDDNGIAGEEYTITAGNNVYAYEDQSDNDAGYSPDGGPSLNFNFPLNLNQDPVLNMDAAITNLFVWNNFMHDVSYFYGFDEESGNFQSNNYNNGGLGDDYVHAQGFDGSGTNNANFGTPEDGFNPRMQMYLWHHFTGDVFIVNAPSVIAGPYNNGFASFGPNVPTIPIINNLVIMNGTSGPSSQGCGNITNAAALNGRIALVDRGGCTFVEKAINAQNAGAIAMVLINNASGAAPTMGGTDNGQVNIPCVSLTQNDGNLIKAQVQTGTVNVSIGGVITERIFDSNFDNGIICHEYGHGISNRLTGGPSNSDCLGNEEQAGEGWSDFFALVMTEKSTSTINDVWGIGNYADGHTANASGIRPFPYTLNMTTNPVTYNHVSTLSVPHGVGSVWCSMIWDLYLNLVSIYGHSRNLYSTGGGNNIAIQLVMEGMRLQACSPGFVDSRDAILQADHVLYNGVHRCIIWKTFARRGLGFSADQGSSFSVGDETVAFDLPATCTNGDVDFYAKSTSTCAGQSIQFQNLVFPVGSSFNWSFPGGTPSISTDAAPTVIYPTAGTYAVMLTANNINGSSTVSKQSYITITQGLNYTVTTTLATNGNSNGTASVSQLSGQAPYTYSWAGFPNVNSSAITGLAAGNYSVTVTDNFGCTSTQQFEIKSSVGIETDVVNNLLLFPNPTTDVLYISTIGNEIRSLKITDISGKEIVSQVINKDQTTLDVSSFAAGMYIVSLQIGESTVVKRFVKK